MTPHKAFGGVGSIDATANSSNKCFTLFGGLNIASCVTGFSEYLFNLVVLPLANLFLSLSGVLLNAAMIVTLNMSTLVSASGGVVDATWGTIRDISSILIIFFLLFTSLQIIVGLTNSKVQHIIIMVVISGILINFSLFFTKVAIDTSNLVGLAFYRAIAPSGANLNLAQSGGNYLQNAMTSGGISDEFMQALKIQTTYSFSATTTTAAASVNPLSVITAGLGGVLIMIIAGLSFMAAALLFAIRVGLLIILMAFSPVYFIGLIIPDIKKKLSDRWLNMLVDQCLILPIYMFFMYIALRVITNPSFQATINPGGASGGTALFPVSTVGTVMVYLIGIILICLPLIAALEYASVGKDWVNAGIKNVKKWGQGAVSGTAGFAGRNTLGWAATKANESEAMRRFYANNPNVGMGISKGLSSISSSSFGGKKGGFEGSRKASEKSRKDIYKRIGTVNRENYSSQEEFDRAEKDALISQRQYVNQLKSTPLATFMSGRRSGYGLEKEQAKSENIASLKESRKRDGEISKEMDNLDNQIKELEAQTSNSSVEQDGVQYQTYTNEQLNKMHENVSKLVVAKVNLEKERYGLDKKIKDLQKEADKESEKTLRRNGRNSRTSTRKTQTSRWR